VLSRIDALVASDTRVRIIDSMTYFY
jgi:hypothetical protein